MERCSEWQGFIELNDKDLEKNYPTELSQESLQYIIDIARPTQSPDEILQSLSENIVIQNKDNTTKQLDWKDGLNYKAELCEAVFPLIDQIVTNHHPQTKGQVSIKN